MTVPTNELTGIYGISTDARQMRIHPTFENAGILLRGCNKQYEICIYEDMINIPHLELQNSQIKAQGHHYCNN